MNSTQDDKEAEQRRDAILKRMLETPPKPHKPIALKKPLDKKREQDSKESGGNRRR